MRLLFGLCRMMAVPFLGGLLFLAGSVASAEIVYQTVSDPNSPFYRAFVTQVTGNALAQFGDEIVLGGTARRITNIALGTQTFFGEATPEYTPAFIEVTLWLNDGPTVSADGTVPDGNLWPGTIIAKSRVAGPTYPAGGVHFSDPGIIVNFPFNDVSQGHHPVGTLVPDRFTFTMVPLNANGEQDGLNPASAQWGPWLHTGRTSNASSGVTTNVVGDSQTGPWVSFSNTGHWIWQQPNGSSNWLDARLQNLVPEATITAVVPEPSAVALALSMAAALSLIRRRKLRVPSEVDH